MICLFGGTFDPVHLGHLHAARCVCEALGLSEIRLVLSARPSHRAAPGASIDQRWDMLRLACGEDARFAPDDREIRRGAPSFTVDTLEEVRAEHSGESLVWVIGSDAYALLPSWYRWERVLALCHLLVLKRPGYPLNLDPQMQALTAERAAVDLKAQACGGVRVLERPMREISAEAVRSRIANGEPVGDLLPAPVAAYIKQHGLYGGRS